VNRTPEFPAHEVIDDDYSLVHGWRVAQLTRLGIPRPLAEAVAADVDWHQIAQLVGRGCPPRLALRILLLSLKSAPTAAARRPARLLSTSRAAAACDRSRRLRKLQ
jgi:hypothetical protein